MNGAMGNFRGSNKKEKRVAGGGQEYFNVTNAGGQFNFQNQGNMGSGQKVNPKAITKSNFYNSGIQNTLGLQQNGMGNADPAMKSPQHMIASGSKRFNFNSTIGFS